MQTIVSHVLQADILSTIGVFELKLSAKGGARLVPTWRFKARAAHAWFHHSLTAFLQHATVS
jgi:hypothetical protein